VVEDDVSIRKLSTEVLIHSGYAVDAAKDGAAAWEALQADSYDLMITDNSMPKVTGVELLKKLRAARMALPVIMTTGTLPKEEFTRSPWIQPAAVLLKPYSVTEFLETVRKVLSATAARREQTDPPPTRQKPAIKPEVGKYDNSDPGSSFQSPLRQPGHSRRS
jgi:DNA-binding response OmpR family regulator